MASIPVCMAPDPNTRVPKYRPPPGACDAHCHIFGPGDKYPYAPDRSYTPPDAPLERFMELQKTLGSVACRARQRELSRRRQHRDLGCDRAERRPLPRRCERRRELHGSRLSRSCTTAVSAASASTSCSTWAARPTWASSSGSSRAPPRSVGTSCCISMPRICSSSIRCCARCRCRSSSTTWAACRRRTASIRSRSRSC